MVVMNHAMLLLLAHRFSSEAIYREAALEHVHYLLGRNALDISYVSGFGDRPVRSMHYRPSVAAGLDTPLGLVAGGPNAGLHDEYAKAHLQNQAPAYGGIKGKKGMG
ncbi:putative glycoside hydrolase [Paenibacillus sp. 598K]|nr:putative glycoside hydrolase [Paenibacillus sp. 598K]